MGQAQLTTNVFLHPKQQYEKIQRELQIHLLPEVAEEVEAYVQHKCEEQFQVIHGTLSARYDALRKYVYEPLQKVESKEEFHECIRQFFTYTNVTDVIEELKELFILDHLQEDYESFLEGMSKNEYGKIFQHLSFDRSIFVFLQQGLLSDLDQLSDQLTEYALAVKAYSELLQKMKSQAAGRTFAKIGASIFGSLIAGPFGAFAARGMMSSFYDENSRIGQAMEEVDEAWNAYTDSLIAFLNDFEVKYRHVMMAMYGGVMLKANHHFTSYKMEFSALATLSQNYELCLVKDEEAKTVKWANETISTIQALFNQKEYTKALQIADPFFHYVNQSPVLGRTIVKENRSVKYFAHLMKFSAIGFYINETKKTNLQKAIEMIHELFKQNPMILQDSDIQNIGAPTQTELGMFFVHQSLGEKKLDRLETLLDYMQRILDRWTEGGTEPGEQVSDVDEFPSFMIALCAFLEEKKKWKHPIIDASKQAIITPSSIRQTKKQYSQFGGKDAFSRYLSVGVVTVPLFYGLGLLVRPFFALGKMLSFKKVAIASIIAVVAIGLYVKRDYLLAFGGNLFLKSEEPTSGEPVEIDTYLTITTDSANIRDIPSLQDSNVVTVVSSGSELLFLNEEMEDEEGRLWYKIEAPDGVIGWISSKITSFALNEAPVTSSNSSFLDNLAQGQLEGMPIPYDTTRTVESIIEELGEPEHKQYWGGGYGLFYEEYAYYVDSDFAGALMTAAELYGPQIAWTPDEYRRDAGSPSSEGFSDMDGEFVMVYETSDYIAMVFFEDESSHANRILLKDVY
ncbi:SH3 domain-containing protein [Bacillus salitolerans]|uniref:SH3 domain-containing protein n=1 Tax=Bacillus salitolerans TaxID=1437434 RepID=A0ABW4LZI1_9BACI